MGRQAIYRILLNGLYNCMYKSCFYDIKNVVIFKYILKFFYVNFLQEDYDSNDYHTCITHYQAQKIAKTKKK